MNINLANCKTSAQATTKICYDEKTRNLNFRIQCEDLEDLKKCVYIIDGYNGFDWKKVNKALDKYVSLKRYYGEDNPNNGKNFFEFDIARESSPAMYIKYYGERVYDGKGHKRFTPDMFKSLTDGFRAESMANECSVYEEGGFVVCRLWWD